MLKKFKFKGINKETNYFEGWYLKLISKNNKAKAFIFGVSLNEKDPHSFIQVVDSNGSKYFRFSIDDFFYNENLIFINNNILHPELLKIDIPNFKIDIEIEKQKTLKPKIFNSVMGPFKYFPLPTYYEIVYMNAKFSGTITENDSTYNISGNAYLEKNWGNKFPSKWLWVNANKFLKTEASFTLVIANIFNKKVFLSTLLLNNKEYRFTSYNGSKFETNKTKNNIFLKKGNLELYLNITPCDEHLIMAPTSKGKMNKKIHHSINSTVKLTLYCGRTIIFNDKCNLSGYENLYY